MKIRSRSRIEIESKIDYFSKKLSILKQKIEPKNRIESPSLF